MKINIQLFNEALEKVETLADLSALIAALCQSENMAFDEVLKGLLSESEWIRQQAALQLHKKTSRPLVNGKPVMDIDDWLVWKHNQCLN